VGNVKNIFLTKLQKFIIYKSNYISSYIHATLLSLCSSRTTLLGWIVDETGDMRLWNGMLIARLGTRAYGCYAQFSMDACNASPQFQGVSCCCNASPNSFTAFIRRTAMGRLVKAGPPLAKAARVAATGTDYAERVSKYIPGEIVAGYIALSELINAVPPTDERRITAAWFLFFVGFLVTPVYLYFTGKPANRRERLQIAIPTVAFVLWAYALGGPFELSSPLPVIGPYASWLGALAVGIFTWVAGLFKP
jgi:hypothetical protein